MKVILYMATSVNGYITHGPDDSDWVSKVDWQKFNELMLLSKVVVMGRNTYYQFGDEFPVKGALNVVMTHDAQLLKKSIPDKALFTDQSPSEVLKRLEKEGFSQVMLIGGEALNTAFMKAHLIDEIWLSVHPYFIGQGKMLTQPFETFEKLSFIGSKKLAEGLVQLRYRVGTHIN